jgi:hypothetical protein
MIVGPRYWTIGPYWTPVAIIGPDGRHTDGSVVRLSDRQADPAYFWFVYLIVIVCLTIGWVDRRWHRS